jgi:hypothetical protein
MPGRRAPLSAKLGWVEAVTDAVRSTPMRGIAAANHGLELAVGPAVGEG